MVPSNLDIGKFLKCKYQLILNSFNLGTGNLQFAQKNILMYFSLETAYFIFALTFISFVVCYLLQSC
jgi:hypothetical protein